MTKTFEIGYGSPTHIHLAEAQKNFTNGSYSSFSFTTTPVEILTLDGNDDTGIHGTGFFWRQGKYDWVVTCSHVLSGKNPFTGGFLSNANTAPPRFRVWGWDIASEAGEDIAMKRVSFTINSLPPLALEAFAKPPCIDGEIVDIAAIPVPIGFPLKLDGSPKVQKLFGSVEPCLNLAKFDKIATGVGDECVILGYPLRNFSGLRFPIWKKGSLATESHVPVDNLPAFLIDAATSSAMSGSPVLRRSGAVTTVEKGTNIVREIRGHQLIGVYAGRLQNAELERINVGYAWYSSLIPKVVDYWEKIWEETATEFAEIIAANAVDSSD